MNKPTLCLDFDGVLHSYKSGWQGAHIVSDPPVPGAMTFICDASVYFTVAIYSSRSHQPGGIPAMRGWLEIHMGIEQPDHEAVLDAIEWPDHKPAAFISIDDRALTFTGEWPALADLRDFKPWNKR